MTENDLLNHTQHVTNNMLFNASKFQAICYSSHASVDSNFIYKDHEDNPIAWFDHLKDIGIYMLQNLTFVEQINTVYKQIFPAYGLDSKNFHIQRNNSYAFAI